jgi:hypothetical protein
MADNAAVAAFAVTRSALDIVANRDNLLSASARYHQVRLGGKERTAFDEGKIS